MTGPGASPAGGIAFLRTAPLFAGLDEGVLARLARAGRLLAVAKGKVLFTQNDSAEAFYVVRSGRVVLLLDSPDGRERVIGEMRAGDTFGELGLITGQTRSTTAVARESSELLAIPRGEFLALIEADALLARRLLETTARWLSHSSEREGALAFLEAPARLARTLLQLDRQNRAEGFITLGQEELAQRIGLTRQTVAKTLGQWRRAGWVFTGRGKIMVVNRAALRRLAQQADAQA